MRGVALPLLAAPLLAALLLHGLALALAATRPAPRPRPLPAPADDTPELLQLSRAAELAAATPGGSGPDALPALPAVPALPQPSQPAPRRAPQGAPQTPSQQTNSKTRQRDLQREPDPRSTAPAVRLRQLQAQAAGLVRLWERATPVTAPLPAALAGLPAGVERRRLPSALARPGAAPHGSAVAVPGGMLLVWHGGGSVWLLRAPLQPAAASDSAAGEGGGAREQPAKGLSQGGGAEHPVAEPQHDPPRD